MFGVDSRFQVHIFNHIGCCSMYFVFLGEKKKSPWIIMWSISSRTCRSQLYSIKFQWKKHIFWYVGQTLYMLVYYFQNINLNWKRYWTDKNNSAISYKNIIIKTKKLDIENNVYVFLNINIFIWSYLCLHMHCILCKFIY